MRLYLSSYRLGPQPDLFVRMNGGRNRVALILSAGDAWGDEAHERRLMEQTEMLASIGMEAADVDLRHYVNRSNDLEQLLQSYGSVWVAGGNTFVLRRATYDSGFDRVITRMLENDAIAYGGYSAGICVLAPSLKGLHVVDDPAEVELAFQREVIWDGLGLLRYTPIPHFQSDYPESERIDDTIAYLKLESIPYKTLRDGKAIVIEGKSEHLLANRLELS